MYARVETIIDPLLPQEQAGFWHGTSGEDQVTLLPQDIEDTFSAKKNAGAVLSTSEQPTTPYGTVVSPASCYDCCLTDTWSTWSWRWLAIAALPLPPEMAKGVGYDASRTACHRDLSWRPFCSTSTPLTCEPPSPESRHMLTIMHAGGNWRAVDGALNKDMATLGEYLQTWKLKLSTTKTVSAVFHLNNKEAKREVKVNYNNETLPICSVVNTSE